MVGINNMADCYEHGYGVEQDLKKAVELYRQAADRGNPTAMESLGCMYEEGRGVPQDPVKAVELYRQAADAGNHMGEYRLGRCYEQGTGVRKDRHRAMELYRQASAGGCKEAGEALKRLRAGGHGHGLLGWLRGK